MARFYAHRLREVMDERDISGQALARCVEPDNETKRETVRTAISHYRRGRKMTRATAERLAPCLSLTADDLLIEEALPALTIQNEVALRRLVREELEDVLAELEKILRLLENGAERPGRRAAP